MSSSNDKCINYTANTKWKSLSAINLLRCIANEKFINNLIKVIILYFAVDKGKLMETTENLKKLHKI